MTEYRDREITPRLLRALKSLPVVVLSGLRQAGKSTLLQHEPGIASIARVQRAAERLAPFTQR